MEVGRQILQCQTNSEAFAIDQQRRSANYKPNIWKYDFLQSLSSKYDEEQYKTQAERLRQDVKHLFVETVDLQAILELVDCIRKLGLASHFNDEIKEALDSVASSMKNNSFNGEGNLYFAALSFRLLRQHGYEVSQDVFGEFLDEKGTSMKIQCEDIKGVLEVYEASHLAVEGETILDYAKAFSARILKGINNCTVKEGNIFTRVVHALELPHHWRVQWFDVKWQIDAYENDQKINKLLIDFAKINFNIVQATLQKDLKEISRWWRNLGLTETLKFTRDRLVESFLCSVGLVFEPHFSCFRKWLTKAIVMVLVIDDVYDIYGSLEELEHFTSAVNRWDSRIIQQLPECMQICFQVLDSIVNETASEMERENGWNHAQPHLKKRGQISVKHYLWNQNEEDMLDFFGKNQELVYNISLIIRLCNDLGTSEAEQERGDAASSILCHMKETNVSEETARTYIKDMISKSWKKVNGQCIAKSPKLQSLVNINTNMARVVHNLYQYGDGFGVQDRENKRQISPSWLIHSNSTEMKISLLACYCNQG
ncbi:hypothetical protein GH714_020045 [Hevea brasiliensis]|uniref:Terpene synthase N-terminal domain-containing protein n=1 Tax=Hevea brasiliensis TaxID=3981 RepID=A0A6A6LSZ1_HEVBR|nr:hypothetical protein GH714_020045 [Hevea brasiliensis]